MARPTLACWNGEEMPLEEVRVPALDRAFLFGDAVYEGLRAYGGRAWLAREHFERLARSLRELRVDANVERCHQRMIALIRHSGIEEGFIYIQITRGVAPRTHYFPKTPTPPNELIYVQDYGGDPYAAVRDRGVSVITHPDTRWSRRDIKSVNLLGNCMASQAAVERGAAEAILVEPEGLISEGTHTSVFGVKEGQLLTAPTSHHILPGVTRGFVLELARRAGIPILEQAFRHNDLRVIDELFLTGTSTEILGVTMVDGRPVGDGAPGPITRRLYQGYRAAVRDWLASGAPGE